MAGMLLTKMILIFNQLTLLLTFFILWSMMMKKRVEKVQKSVSPFWKNTLMCALYKQIVLIFGPKQLPRIRKSVVLKNSSNLLSLWLENVLIL